MNNLPQTIEAALIGGDLSKMDSAQRVVYYNRVCESLGLNPLTKPFEYITLNGKLTLYARRDATDQLRSLKKISVTIKSREKIDDVYVVTAQASNPDGRTDEAIGVVAIGASKGEAMANALMKAETKAKRRVTLSICGLGLLDETEIEDQPKIESVTVQPANKLLEMQDSIRKAAEEGISYEYDLSECDENTKKLIVGAMKVQGFWANAETKTYHTAIPVEVAKPYLINLPEANV